MTVDLVGAGLDGTPISRDSLGQAEESPAGNPVETRLRESASFDSAARRFDDAWYSTHSR